ncbi:MAG: tail fiber domain-containing protein [Acidobacteria bacterium]|nr:tail fiber domain-containing protein [Acidobacteriota bacterium]
MGSPVKKLPFDKTGEVETSVKDTPDIQAARDYNPDLAVLDAATMNDVQMTRDDNERRVNSAYAAGVPNSFRVTQPARLDQKLMAQRGYALAQGEDARNRLKLQQKLALADLTKSTNVRSREYGYSSGIKESPGILGSLAEGFGKTLGAAAVTSDERLKENITPAASVLNRLGNYEAKDWTWKEDGQPDTGVVAQDVEASFPEVVTASPDGVKMVEYGKLGALALQGVKELDRKLNRLMAQKRAAEKGK